MVLLHNSLWCALHPALKCLFLGFRLWGRQRNIKSHICFNSKTQHKQRVMKYYLPKYSCLFFLDHTACFYQVKFCDQESLWPLLFTGCATDSEHVTHRKPHLAMAHWAQHIRAPSKSMSRFWLSVFGHWQESAFLDH